jgi:hypothetical protein
MYGSRMPTRHQVCARSLRLSRLAMISARNNCGTVDNTKMPNVL